MTFGACAVVVDDDHDSVEIMSEYLEIRGVRVVGKGYDGKDAFELYKKLRPDVVIMDAIMPGNDGIYGLEEIQRFDPNSRIIIITGDITQKTKNCLLKMGVAAIIYKPYDMDHIITTITEILENKIPQKLGTFDSKNIIG